MNMTVECLNQANAQVGDRVELEMKTENVLGAAFIAYLIPLAMFLLGVVGGMKVLASTSFSGNIEAGGAGIGFVLMFITYIVIKMNDKKFKQSEKYLSVVTKVLDKEETSCS